MNYSCLPFFVFKTEHNELIPIRLNDEGIMLPDCHSQWYHSKSNELIFRRQSYIILPEYSSLDSDDDWRSGCQKNNHY